MNTVEAAGATGLAQSYVSRLRRQFTRQILELLNENEAPD
jgi:hypothetical protein